MTIHDLIVGPFEQYAFMKRALASCFIIALGGTPLGLFMTLRRMTLAGDAMSHAILPGVAVAFIVSGLSVWPMTLGGLIAGFIVATAAVLLTRFTHLKEDAAITLLYLLSLAAGATLVSLKGNSVDLMHLLFGNILGVNREALWMMTGSTCLTLGVMAIIYRRLVIDCFDPEFMMAATAHQGKGNAWTRQIFLMLVMVNLIAAFQALGTLMALGLMILPCITARFWTRSIDCSLVLGITLAIISSWAGLLISYYGQLPTAPAIVLTMGSFTLASALLGRHGSFGAYLSNRS